MRTVYPVFIKNIDNKYYSIYLPDFDTHTSTEYLDLWEAFEMSRDLLNLMYVTNEDMEKANPKPSTYGEAIVLARKHTEMGYSDYSNDLITYVDIDTDEYREFLKSIDITK